jgi:hypothetical protein
MKAKKEYDLLSPDGFSIFPDRTYSSKTAVEKAYKEWVAKFKKQGYYSSNNGRIDLEDLPFEMQFIEVGEPKQMGSLSDSFYVKNKKGEWITGRGMNKLSFKDNIEFAYSFENELQAKRIAEYYGGIVVNQSKFHKYIEKSRSLGSLPIKWYKNDEPKNIILYMHQLRRLFDEINTELHDFEVTVNYDKNKYGGYENEIQIIFNRDLKKNEINSITKKLRVYLDMNNGFEDAELVKNNTLLIFLDHSKRITNIDAGYKGW